MHCLLEETVDEKCCEGYHSLSALLKEKGNEKSVGVTAKGKIISSTCAYFEQLHS